MTKTSTIGFHDDSDSDGGGSSNKVGKPCNPNAAPRSACVQVPVVGVTSVASLEVVSCKPTKGTKKWKGAICSVELAQKHAEELACEHNGKKYVWCTFRPKEWTEIVDTECVAIVGCSMCAASLEQRATGRGSKMCRYEMPSQQKSQLINHAKGSEHRQAVELFFKKELKVKVLLDKGNLVAHETRFKGCVPQPRDWMRAWMQTKTMSNNCSHALHAELDGFGVKMSGANANVDKMQFIMAEVLRDEGRDAIENAVDISLSAGEKSKSDAVLFVATGSNCKTTTGVLGLLERMRVDETVTAEDAEDRDAGFYRCAIGVKNWCKGFLVLTHASFQLSRRLAGNVLE